jgi:hypothetical protein
MTNHAPLTLQPYAYLPARGIGFRFRQFFDILLTFAFIFSFQCYFIWRSSVVPTVFLFMLLLLNRPAAAETLQLAFSPYVRRIIILFAVIVAYAWLCTNIQLSYEYEQVRATSTQFLQLAVCLALYVYLRRRHGVEGTLRIVFYAFVLQSLIQMGGYASSDFLTIVRYINPEDLERPGEHVAYIQFRAFAMAGVKHFGLSVVYSYVMIFYVFLRGKKMDLREILLLVIFCAGACFTARSFFLGIGASLLLLALTGRAEILAKIAMGTCSSILAATFLFSENLKERLQSDLLPWLFEAWHTYQATGRMETRSSKVLFEGHYFNITAKQMAFGDGLYVWPGGVPYGDTDAGYWRLILFGGIPYLVLRGLLCVLILWPLLTSPRQNAKIAFAGCFSLLLFFQVKGDIFTGLTSLLVILFLLGLIVRDIGDDYVQLQPLPQNWN